MNRIKRYEYLSGKCKWCRTSSPDNQYGWGIVLYPNDESLEKFRKLQAEGLKTHLNKDEDGYFFNCRRLTQKVTQTGKKIFFEKPELVDAKNVPMGDTLVGNGSDVTIKAEVYEYQFQGKKGIAWRLAAVRVENLVPYAQDSFEPGSEEELATRGLRDQPLQPGLNPGF